ncbi:MAG TPA: hypothetical protein P5089_03260 [Candidatus Portnoybacteria bacterium]|nr:hypothetical protein [Candidatus Portnoybacteria bacterium]
MDLGDLKKQLFKKEGQFAGRPTLPEDLEPGNAAPQIATQDQWNSEQGQGVFLSPKRKRIIWFSLAGAGFLALVFGGWLLWRTLTSFDSSGVSLDIFGQERVVSGEEITFVVRYKNNSRVAISNATLLFYFSSQSSPTDKDNVALQGDSYVATKNLGQLTSGQEGQAEFKVRVLGDKDSQQKFKAKLNYRPSNVNSDFSNEKEFVSTIISVPLVLSFILPEKIVSGQTMNFSLRYLNTSDASFSDAKLKIEYPEGFIFDSALPSPDSSSSLSPELSNTWSLPEIGSREEGNIVIKGILSGTEGDSKVFKAQIGSQKEKEDFIVYSQTLSALQVSSSPLFIEQSLSGAEGNNANIGQGLTYKIKYRNTTSVAIGPVFITVKIDSRVVDLASVKATDGFFSSSDGLITWNSSSLSALESLAPKTEGALEFSLQVKDRLPVSTFSDKNFIITTTAKIDSFNVPLALSGTQLSGQNQLLVKINSPLVINMKGFYNDKIIPNSGPLPPRVGQKTTYTIYWQALNVSNDLSNVAVEAYLPSYVSWEGNIYPKDEDIKYDAASGKIVWQIGRLSAGTGILSPVRQAVFQVGFTPSIGQVGNEAIIVKSAQISGQDNFTNVQLSASDEELKSGMPDDPVVIDSKSRVTQ